MICTEIDIDLCVCNVDKDYEKVVSFLNGSDDASLTVFSVRGWDQLTVSASTFIRREGNDTETGATLYQNEAGEVELHLDEFPIPLDSLVLTEK